MLADIRKFKEVHKNGYLFAKKERKKECRDSDDHLTNGLVMSNRRMFKQSLYI